MADTDGSSPISTNPSVEDLFAQALASVERHSKRGAHGEGPADEPQAEGVVVDFEMSDLDDLGAPPADVAAADLGEGDADRRVAEVMEEVTLLKADLNDARARLQRREQDIAAMLKRFEEAQKRYKAKVQEAEAHAQRAAELKATLDLRSAELKRMVDHARRSGEQVEAVRRRAGRERDELQRYGSEKPLRAILSVVDNLERALSHAETSPHALHEGVEMILTQLLGILGQSGVRSVPSRRGDRFDPNVHEAMVRVEAEDIPAGAVHEVLQKGYLFHDRLLRAALVSVAQGPMGADASEVQDAPPSPAPAVAPAVDEAAEGDLDEIPDLPSEDPSAE